MQKNKTKTNEPWIDQTAVRLIRRLTVKSGFKSGFGDLTKQPTRLELNDIKTFPELFQPRDLTLDQRHIGDLVRALQQRGTRDRPGNLEAVLVLFTHEGYVLVDGHHRLEAYRRAGRKFIPVMIFRGTVEEAVLQSRTENSKAKRTMSTKERMNSAWRLVRQGCHSIREIAEAASVGTSQVSQMRVVARKLGENAALADTWWKAHFSARQAGLIDKRGEKDMAEARSNAIAEKLSDVFGTKLLGEPAVVARALQLYFGNTLQSVLDELNQKETEGEGEGKPEGVPFPIQPIHA